MYRPRTAVIPGLGTVTPTGDISASEWLPVQEEALLSMTRTYDTRAFGGDVNAAINQCHANGGGTVFVGEPPTPGQDIVLKDKVYLTGRGIGATTLNINTIRGSGSIDPMPVPTGTVFKDARTITFASAHGLEPGDVFILYNPNDYSFSPARPMYRAGEFCRVRSVASSTSVTLTNPTFGLYNPGEVQVYRMTPIRTGVSNMTIICTEAETGIKISYGTELVFDNLAMRNSRVSHLTLDRCYNVSISKFSAFDYHPPTPGFTVNYGITVSNSQRIRLHNLDVETYRPGFVTGGDDGVCSVPNRDIIVSDSYINGMSDAAGVTGCSLHGNSEFVQFNNCIMPGGAKAAGDYITYRNCDIRSTMWGGAVHSTELIGVNITFENCRFTATNNNDSNYGLIFLNFAEHLIRSNGTFRFINNFVDHANYETQVAGITRGMMVALNSNEPLGSIHAEVRDNRFFTMFGSGTRSSVRFNSVGSLQWTSIDIHDNKGNMEQPRVISGTTLPYFVGEGLAVPTFPALPGSMYRRTRTTTAAATALYVNRDGSSTWRAIDV